VQEEPQVQLQLDHLPGRLGLVVVLLQDLDEVDHQALRKPGFARLTSG